MTRTYLVAPAGLPNFGDELIWSSWVEYLLAERPDDELWLDCHTPGSVPPLLQGRQAPGLSVTNTLWRLVEDAAARPEAERETFVRRCVREGGTPMYDLGIEELRRADVVHVLGGGYLNDRWPHHVALLWALDELRRVRRDTRLVATGQGLLPAGTGWGSMAALLSTFNHVSVRDAGSARLLGTPRGLDDAFLSRPVREQTQHVEAPDLCLCVQEDLADPGMVDLALEVSRRVAGAVRARGGRVAYVEAIPGWDWPAYDRLRDVVDEFIPFAEVWRSGLPVREGQQWVTTRFHLHLLAAAAGAAGACVGVSDDYYRAKHQSLLDLGTGWTYVGPGTGPGTVAPTCDPGFRDRAREASAAKVAEARELYPSSQH